MLVSLCDVRYTTNPHGSYGAMHIIRVDVTFLTTAKVAFSSDPVNIYLGESILRLRRTYRASSCQSPRLRGKVPPAEPEVGGLLRTQGLVADNESAMLRSGPHGRERRYAKSSKATRGGAVWSARRAHNPKVVGSNPTPATKSPQVIDLGALGVCGGEVCTWRPLSFGWRRGLCRVLRLRWRFTVPWRRVCPSLFSRRVRFRRPRLRLRRGFWPLSSSLGWRRGS